MPESTSKRRVTIAPMRLCIWYRKLTATEKKELAEYCKVSKTWLSTVMCRRAPMSMNIALGIVAYSKGDFKLKELDPEADVTTLHKVISYGLA